MNVFDTVHGLMGALLQSNQPSKKVIENIEGLAQERRNSIANALDLRLFCTNPSIYYHPILQSAISSHGNSCQVSSLASYTNSDSISNYLAWPPPIINQVDTHHLLVW